MHAASHISVAGVAQIWAQSHGHREELCLKSDGAVALEWPTMLVQPGGAMETQTSSPVQAVGTQGRTYLLCLCGQQALRLDWTCPPGAGHQGGQGVPAHGCLSVVSRQGVPTRLLSSVCSPGGYSVRILKQRCDHISFPFRDLL